ncbi:transposase [Plakobranchus ocellatus]|uniref:Transposase n=1 Tax=Plakobranchus ocellatus TaxID=259542 RepID=A0AAV3ZNM2_9GAST|nr:transposase [Plakobranchus ocellatus]
MFTETLRIHAFQEPKAMRKDVGGTVACKSALRSAGNRLSRVSDQRIHSANLTQQWLQRYGWEILPHPAHSPDLAPSDFHLFGPLKRHLGGMAFETEDDLISELRNWFDNLDVDFFRVGINSLLSRWQKCIDLHGDYVEK